MSGKTMKLTLKVWRQKNASAPGRFVTYDAPNVSPDMSFLEMLDVVNERLIETGHAYADWRFSHPHKDRFLAAERRARRERCGLWAGVRPDQMPGWRQRSRRGRSSPPPTSAARDGHLSATTSGVR